MNSLLDATDDPVAEIRKYACLGIQRYPGPETIETLVNVLQKDEDSNIRALAADSLSRMPEDRAFTALVSALQQEASEDVKMAVIRALGKRSGWQTEQILIDAIQNTNDEEMPAFLWAGIRSLGQVGGTERSVMVLRELQGRITNDIILSAIQLSIRKIQSRIDDLRQLERQLGEATPMAVAVPSEYEEEVALVEDEVPHEMASAQSGDSLLDMQSDTEI
jgi:HEAT repeat protein